MFAPTFVRRVIVAATVLFATIAGRAATLPLDITILQGNVETVRTGEKQREVMFLVLDHSGSMNETDGRDNSRWQALLDSLATTLRSVRVGTEIRVEWIESSWEKDRRGNLVRRRGNLVRNPVRRTEPVVLSGPESWKSIWDDVKNVGDPDESNGTPLFETLEKVSVSARELVRKGDSVAVVVFSDGDSNEQDKEDRRKKLDKEFSPLFSDKRFKTCLVWINPASAPSTDGILGGKWNVGYEAPPAIYTTSAEPAAITVENPLSGGTGRGALSYAFHVPMDVWKKMEGRPAQISLVRQTEGGLPVPVGAATLEIRRGLQKCTISVSDDKLAGAGLSLRLSKIPSPEGTVVSPPPSVDVLLVEPDRLSISSVAPSAGTVVREGEDIAFSVMATPGSSIEWAFDDGFSAKGDKVVHAYKNAGTYNAKVLVRKDGFAPREGISETRRIEVVRASVALSPFDPPVVGREVAFSCKGIGPVTGYSWIVDGEELAGVDSPTKDSSKLAHTFLSSGSHTIQVCADLDRLGSVLSEKKTFSVGAAPFLRVDDPVSGMSFVAGERILLKAWAEGGIVDIRWIISDVSGTEAKTLPAPVANSVSMAEASLEKPGEYTVRAMDAAGAASSTDVSFTIRPRDLSLSISEPADGKRIETGDNIVFKASAKGVAKVAWSIRDEETGKETQLGETPVGADGYATKAWTFPREERTGFRTILLRDAAGAIEADPIRVELRTEGSVKLVEPADYVRVPFGSNVVLRAAAIGAAKDIRWFVDDKEYKHKGEAVTFVPERTGAPEQLFRVQATASMPSGESLPRTLARTIVAYCPALEPRLDLSKKDWDVESPVTLKVVSPVGHVGKVFWSFGDGEKDEEGGATHSHVFKKDGNYAVSARVFCADCGASYAAAPVSIAVHCPSLQPMIVFEETNGVMRASFGRRERVEMQVRVPSGLEGRIRSVAWDFGDGSTEAPSARASTHHEYENYADNLKVRATVVCDRCGQSYRAEQTLTVEAQPPRASFAIAPDRSTFTVKSRIKLQDTSGGDVDKCVWTLDGKEFATCGKGESVELDLPQLPAEITIGMTAWNALGATSEAPTRTLRVRFGWLAVLVFLLGGFLVAWGAWRLFGGNAPRDWSVYCWVGGAPVLKKGQYAGEKDFKKGLATDLRDFWSIWRKHARIPLGTMLYGDPDYEVSFISPEALKQKWRFTMDEGDPVVEPEGTPTWDPQSGMVRGANTGEFSKCYFLFLNTSSDAKDAGKYVRFYVDRTGAKSWRYPALLLISILLVLAVFAWACWAYAI